MQKNINYKNEKHFFLCPLSKWNKRMQGYNKIKRQASQRINKSSQSLASSLMENDNLAIAHAARTATVYISPLMSYD